MNKNQREFTRDFMEGWLDAHHEIVGGVVPLEIIEEGKRQARSEWLDEQRQGMEL